MGIKHFWFNLPVKDVEKSKAFYRALGFKESDMHQSNKHMGRFFIGEQKVGMLLFPEETFKEYTNQEITNTSKSTEVLLNIDAASKDEVYAYARVAKEAGGELYLEPVLLQGFMFTCGFTDIDGHRWNVLYMDVKEMPK